MAIQNLNINPYHDDYDEAKGFHRILFRPGYAVQARELTQLQTILQNQVSRFGNHIFKEGSIVTGGEITYSNSVRNFVLQRTDINGNDIDVNNFNGKVISDLKGYQRGGGYGKVLAVDSGDSSNAPSIIVELTTAASQVYVNVNTAIYTIETTTNTAITATSNYSSNASIASINSGIFYTQGYFVYTEAQTIILDNNSATPSYKVGLEISDEIVTELSDTSLLDPALDSSNFQAPGATRLQLTLTLAKRSLTSEDDTKFIELMRVENGVVTKIKRYTEYAELEKTLARRTFDESGHYTVRPFLINLKDHVPTPGNTSNTELFTASLSPGKAYVGGFEFETISPTNIELKRARTTQNVSNYIVNTTYGNYFIGANVSGTFDISTMAVSDLHCVPAANIVTTNTVTYGATKIGTARIRQIQYDSSSNTQLSGTYQYIISLFDTRYTAISNNAVSGTANTIVLAAGGAGSPTSNAYLGASLRITTGSANDTIVRKIVNYDGTTRTATVDSAFATSPTSNSVYSIEFNVKDLESVVVPTGTSSYSANADVSVTNKVGSVATGDTFLSDTNYNRLVFTLPQSYVAYGITDQSYVGKKVYSAQVPVSNVVTITTGSASINFIGSGALSDSSKLDNFILVTRTAAAGLPANSVIPTVTATGRSITVTGGTSAAIDLGNSQFTSVDVIATVNYSAATPRAKTLNLANTTNVAVSSGTTIGNTTIYTSHGQVAISTPNKVAGNIDCLYVSDVYRLDGKFEEEYGGLTVTKTDGTTRKSSFKVIDSGNTANAVTVADLSNSSKDITYKYILDDGQRDNYYDHANIILKSGVTPPVGQILVLFNYFTHSGSGFLSVDSYVDSNLGANSAIRYAKIPTYVSPSDGKNYPLRDCIDFRPIRQNSSNTLPGFTLSGIALNKEDEGVNSDYSYYVPRSDRIILRTERVFDVLEGIPDLYPQTPAEPDNAMSLYTVLVPPYTFFPSDAKSKFIENKRYTMRDIGKIEKRVENLEYYATLNTLELETKNLTLTDADGFVRFKNGILVDSFKGHSVGDVNNLDYKCSIDVEKGELRPSFVSTSISFDIDTANTTSNLSFGTIATAPYSNTALITQDVVSSSEKVNPFLFTNFVGTIQLSPSGDVWVDQTKRPDVLVNLEGNNDAWTAIGAALQDSRAPGFGTQYNDWQSIGTGIPIISTQTINTSQTEGYLTYQDTILRTTTSTPITQTRTATTTTVVPDRIVKNIGNRQVDFSVVPYIRAQKVYFLAKNLAPNLKYKAFFDGVDVTNYVERASTFTLYNLSGNFKDEFGNSETITSSSGGTAKILKQIGESWSTNKIRIEVIDVRGSFVANDTITGAVSGVTAKLDVPRIVSGNVSSATANTITLGAGMPYNNIYSNWANTMKTLIAANTFANTTTFNSGIYSESEFNSLYNHDTITIVAGKGLNQTRTIVSYNGSTKTANLSSNWDVQPDSTSIYSLGSLITNDIGICKAGIFHLPSYDATAYDSGLKFRTGVRKFRICDSLTNDETKIKTFADADFNAVGFVNTVEDVSVSVRVPSIQTKSITETRNITSYTVNEQLIGRTVIDNTPSDWGGGGYGGYSGGDSCAE